MSEKYPIPRLVDIVPPSPEPKPETGRWFQTEYGTFGQFMPDTFAVQWQKKRHYGICFEEITVDWTGRTAQCSRPATSTAFDVFSKEYYPVCSRHSVKGE